MLDVDDFKGFNDRNGHEAGNEVLARIGSLLRSSLRHVDVVARYGGEEFALILSMTPKTGARVAAENVRKAIADHVFPGEAGQPGGSLTVSAGIATCPADARVARTLIRHADEALYAAKSEGKNRVCLYGRSSRSYRRLRISLRGSFSSLGGSERPLEAVELSEGGMLLLTEQGLAPGSLLDLSLILAGSRGVVSATARVASAGVPRGDLVQTGVRFVEITAPDRMRLREFLGES
jgi:diguanylate cyclase (GGDEF)-like protein